MLFYSVIKSKEVMKLGTYSVGFLSLEMLEIFMSEEEGMCGQMGMAVLCKPRKLQEKPNLSIP